MPREFGKDAASGYRIADPLSFGNPQTRFARKMPSAAFDRAKLAVKRLPASTIDRRNDRLRVHVESC